jgi:hypothetical protein
MAVGDLLQQPMYTSVFNGPSARTPAATIRRVATQFLASYRDEARIIGVIEMVSRYDPELTSIRFEYQGPTVSAPPRLFAGCRSRAGPTRASSPRWRWRR